MEQRKVRSGIMTPVKGIMTQEERINPFPFLKNMRDTSPVRYDEDRDSWDVFSFEAVHQVLSDPKSFSSDRHAVFNPDQPSNVNLISSDPPKHTQFRNIVNRAFLPKNITDMAPRIQQITTELLDSVVSKGKMDVIDDFAAPLPLIVIAEMLGIPIEDRDLFKAWSDELVQTPEESTPEQLQANMMAKGRVSQELGAYFKKVLDQRRENPGTDLVSVLLKAEVDGESLTEQQLLSFCSLLLVAGNETTTNLITNSVRILTERPELQTQLRENPELMASFIEESLRFYSPVMSLPSRFATCDVELAGQQIKKGDQVVAWIGSANHDTAKFPNPEEFIVDRTPNQHLAFGWGIHFCLGAPLARLEAQVALSEMIRRLPNMQLVPGTELKPIRSVLVYGVKEYPITFDVKESN